MAIVYRSDTSKGLEPCQAYQVQCNNKSNKNVLKEVSFFDCFLEGVLGIDIKRIAKRYGKIIEVNERRRATSHSDPPLSINPNDISFTAGYDPNAPITPAYFPLVPPTGLHYQYLEAPAEVEKRVKDIPLSGIKLKDLDMAANPTNLPSIGVTQTNMSLVACSLCGAMMGQIDFDKHIQQKHFLRNSPTVNADASAILNTIATSFNPTSRSDPSSIAFPYVPFPILYQPLYSLSAPCSPNSPQPVNTALQNHASNLPTLNVYVLNPTTLQAQHYMTAEMHVCATCKRMRSPKYHKNHPIIPGHRPQPGECRRCRSRRESGVLAMTSESDVRTERSTDTDLAPKTKDKQSEEQTGNTFLQSIKEFFSNNKEESIVISKVSSKSAEASKKEPGRTMHTKQQLPERDDPKPMVSRRTRSKQPNMTTIKYVREKISDRLSSISSDSSVSDRIRRNGWANNHSRYPSKTSHTPPLLSSSSHYRRRIIEESSSDGVSKDHRHRNQRKPTASKSGRQSSKQDISRSRMRVTEPTHLISHHDVHHDDSTQYARRRTGAISSLSPPYPTFDDKDRVGKERSRQVDARIGQQRPIRRRSRHVHFTDDSDDDNDNDDYKDEDDDEEEEQENGDVVHDTTRGRYEPTGSHSRHYRR